MAFWPVWRRSGSHSATAWQNGITALGALWETVATAARSALEQIVAGAGELWVQIQALWQAGVDAIGALWETLKAGAAGVWQGIIDGVAVDVGHASPVPGMPASVPSSASSTS